MKPRIRTVKPEMRHDERYARLSYPARELFNGLITMADDEGRFQASTSAILGHVFPHDDVPPRKLRDWIGEVRDSGMILFYVVDGFPYGAFRHWKKHQKINRARPSDYPDPPDADVVQDNRIDNSVINHGNITDRARSHAQARVPVQIPEQLEPHLEKALEVLRALAERHNAKAVNRDSVANVIAARPRKPLVRGAYDCAAYWDAKPGRLKDVVSAYRNWLDRSDDLATVEPLDGSARVISMPRSPALQRADAFLVHYPEEEPA